jgi:hypothetical protein
VGHEQDLKGNLTQVCWITKKNNTRGGAIPVGVEAGSLKDPAER